jgi:hypothetical protein
MARRARRRKACQLRGSTVDCYTLGKQVNQAYQNMLNAYDRPNLTNSEMKALYEKHEARYKRLEAKAKAAGC